MTNDEKELVDKINELLTKRFGAASPATMRQLYDAYDKDGDGQITGSELSELLAAAGVGNRFTRGAWTKGVIGKLDTDSTQTISWDEFSTAVGISS